MKYYLSTDDYHFVYRLDHYDHQKTRATLFQHAKIVDDVAVGSLSHGDIINHFEARITLAIIPAKDNPNRYDYLLQRGLWVSPCHPSEMDKGLDKNTTYDISHITFDDHE